MGEEQLPSGVRSAHELAAAADLNTEVVKATAGCGGASDDEHGGASDGGIEEFGERVAELRGVSESISSWNFVLSFIMHMLLSSVAYKVCSLRLACHAMPLPSPPLPHLTPSVNSQYSIVVSSILLCWGRGGEFIL